jgi:hypothetical protein
LACGPDRRTVDDPILLDHPDREPGQVVLADRVHPGHLGGLAADQRAAGDLAAQRDAADHLGRDLDVELAAGVVVEEEQRPRALDQDVVDVHRHQVLADRVVAPERKGELELGADAVGSGDQHRCAVTLRDLEQRTESADAAEYPGDRGAPRQRLDALDQRRAGCDRYAGGSVSQWRRHVSEGFIGVPLAPRALD